nr:MAG TPA_asm: hypothetical protein [Bacteriophage sp.]DAP05614.1 MAG TPA: hypothetical protein [Caudoviricetes sp.]
MDQFLRRVGFKTTNQISVMTIMYIHFNYEEFKINADLETLYVQKE